MKHIHFSLFFIIFSMMIISCSANVSSIEVNATLMQELENPSPQYESRVVGENLSSISKKDSCQNPSRTLAPTCTAIEEKILASTVRIELHRWLDEEGRRGENFEGGIAHATVKDGRYLITHNHFKIPLSSIEGVSGEQVRISVYKVNGEVILDSVQTSAFTVVKQDSEIVVLDFGEYVGEGLFDILGIPSAEFHSWQSLSLAPGTEVAQINWDYETAFVEWVTIRNFGITNGTPYIELNNGLVRGASGGGIFWNGIHIANNWETTTVKSVGDGKILDMYSSGALNSDLVLN